MAKNFDAAIVLIVLLLAISFDVRPAGRHDVAEERRFTRRTDTVRHELNAPEGAAGARLRVRARVDTGRLAWRLTDPRGRTVVSGRATEGKVETDTGDIAHPEAGVWVLTLDLQDATGHYRLDWRVR
jgi:hypothetical protein